MLALSVGLTVAAIGCVGWSVALLAPRRNP